MVRLSLLATFALPLLASAASEVLNLIPDNFDKVVYKSNKPALVEFFAPWCGHCKTLAPVYAELAAAFSPHESKVSIANVDADAHRDLGSRFGVKGFPTLKWFSGKEGDQGEDYNGGRDLESLTKFVTEKTGLKLKGSKGGRASSVQMLTDTSFKEQVGKEKSVLVAFTAPWCGHCKTLAPIYEKLAHDFEAESSVIIAKVDAEAANSKATAQSQDISGYPTIKFFPAGSTEPETYSGARSEDALVAFVNEKTGLHRVSGGGLSAKAGTIDAIDAILAKYITVTGISNMEQLTAEVKAAAEGLKQKGAEYYLKALAKITGNPEYAMKEQSRLAGILKKGGLAPEKIDDLQKRSNILAKFLVKDGESGDVKDEL